MIGPVNPAAQGGEVIRLFTDRSRQEIAPGAISATEEQTRDEAASPEARTNRSAIVEQAEAVLAELRTAMDDRNVSLRIEEDEEAETFVYKSIDRETGEVLKEWPPEEVRRAMEFLNRLQGVIVNKTA